MLFRPTHDDQMRAIRANAPAETPSVSAELPNGTKSGPLTDPGDRDDAPAQLTRELVDAAIERSRAKAAVTLPAFTVARRMQRLAQARGGMKAFLAHARSVQNLPSFAASLPRGAMKGRRE